MSRDYRMNRQTVSPDNLDFTTPGRRDYYVELEHPSIWGHYLLPVTVLVGATAEPGRGVLVTGATHGNEYEGPIAIKHLLREIRTDDVLGRLILVPLLNVALWSVGPVVGLGAIVVASWRARMEPLHEGRHRADETPPDDEISAGIA